jgi:Tfp pilus assembly protein PilF
LTTLSTQTALAAKAHQAGKLDEARNRYLAILKIQPNHPLANHNLGVLAMQAMQAHAALPYFIAALEADSSCGQYWLSYIDALYHAGQTDDARTLLAIAREQGLQGEEVEALALRIEHATQYGQPDNAAPPTSDTPAPQQIDALMSLLSEGRITEAAQLAQLMTTRYPLDKFGWMALGLALNQLGQNEAALAPMQKVAAMSPDDPIAHFNLGNLFKDLNRLTDAETSYRYALQLKPDYADAHSNLGNILRDSGRLAEACASYRQALKLRPDLAPALNNLGLALRGMGRMDEAEASLRQAIKIQPEFALAHSNLGITLRDMGRLDEAERCFRRSLEIRPDFAELHYNLGYTLLLSEKFTEGWREYEYRWEGSSPQQPRPATTLPLWTGQPTLSSERLLIFKEQGWGDKLQFSRYLKRLHDRFPNGASIVIDPQLQALFRRSFPDIEILDDIPRDQTRWQWQCPLLSLPLAFGTTLDTIPNSVPYLVPDPVRVLDWKARIAALDLPVATRKIGIAWKSGNIMNIAHLKGLPIAHLEPIMNLPGYACFSLQKEPDQERMPWVSSGTLIDWSEEFRTFDDTAALLMNLDLVISVDTSVAHLAGGLGRPTWLLNRYASDWRWMRNRDESPWYPDMRIFTQKTAGDWHEVVNRMHALLCERNLSATEQDNAPAPCTPPKSSGIMHADALRYS